MRKREKVYRVWEEGLQVNKKVELKNVSIVFQENRFSNIAKITDKQSKKEVDFIQEGPRQLEEAVTQYLSENGLISKEELRYISFFEKQA